MLLGCGTTSSVIHAAGASGSGVNVRPKTLVLPPHRDIQVSESFLRDHEELLAVSVRALFEAAADTAGAVDFDVREALDAALGGKPVKVTTSRPYGCSVKYR